jgi:hypothetical protein
LFPEYFYAGSISGLVYRLAFNYLIAQEKPNLGGLFAILVYYMTAINISHNVYKTR